MSDHEPTVTDATDADQPGEALDAEKLPDEIPQKPQASLDHGTTEAEMESGEPLDSKLAREVPDDGAGPDDTTSTPIMDDADESGRDEEKYLVAELPVGEPHVDDSGRPDAPAPAEQSAIHVMRE